MMVSTFENVETTAGLVSGYQMTEVTSAGAATLVTTGQELRFAVLEMPVWLPVPVLPSLGAPWRPQISDEFDQAPSRFYDPLGIPRSHAERATQLAAAFRTAPDEIEYVDVPEGEL